ncbi:unnamed protein product, partial [Closterium sp. NIES-53]
NLDWRDWVCPGCIRCEACQRYGEPSSILCCYRCDRGYHAACTQLHTKSPFKGPFLCPRHTQCHSCGSKVPGSGTSSRWFFNYMLCDACGRLFVKKKHCPVCLRVYRDSEPTPMVCCDKCEHWVHCACDNISDEQYMQYQTNSELSYTCPACLGHAPS